MINMAELEEILVETVLKRQLITYFIWGKHGIGKTSITESLSSRLKFGLRNFRLNQIDSVELIGYPSKKEFTFINEYGVSETIEYLDYAPPKWFVDALKGNYIIFLDEFNRAKKDNQHAAFELVNERSLNGRKLPDSVLIVAAGNPPNKKYDTVDFDDALIDRFCHVFVKSSFKHWKTWASKKDEKGNQKISQEIISFLEGDNSEQTFDFKTAEDSDLPVECVPSPRAWERVNSVFKLDVNKYLKTQLISGCVGSKIANNFMASIESNKKPITLDEISQCNFENNNDPILKRIQLYSGYVDGKVVLNDGQAIIEIPLLNYTCEDICRDENIEFVQKNYIKILTFLTLIPADLSLKTLKKLTTKRINNKENINFWKTKLALVKEDPNTKQPLTRKNPVSGEIEPDYVFGKLIDYLKEFNKAREVNSSIILGNKNN